MLKDGGLVVSNAEGTRRIYRLNPDGVTALRTYLDRVWVSADGPAQTTVEVEHRLLDRLVDGKALRDGITGGGGWPSLLEQFAKAATN